MNIVLVLRIISFLLLIVSGFMLMPAGIAAYRGELAALKSFIPPVIFSLFFAGLMHLVYKLKPDRNLSTRDGFLFVSLSWILASLIGALPFYFSGAIPSMADAYFETMSGFTTTGATILSDIESLPSSILFWRSMTHWLGGMGIVVLTVAVLPLLGIGGLMLVQAESPGPTVDKLAPRIKETAKILWYIYIGLTAAQAALLMIAGMNLFDALTHTFGTVATGGFSPKNSSVGYYNSAIVDWITTLFMVLAGINFTLHFRLISGKPRDLLKDSELKSYIFIFFAAMFIIALDIYGKNYSTMSDSFRFAGFQAASIMTTTGFYTADYEKWPAFSQTVLMVLMFVGGCTGSTGGGIKVLRIITLLKQGLNEMKYLVHPRGIFILKINGQPVKKDMVYAISGFFFLYILLLLATTMAAASSGADFNSSFTASLCTVGNVGPGLGLVGPTKNFGFFPDYVKWFLSFAMLTGRLELYTVLILFTRTFWKR